MGRHKKTKTCPYFFGNQIYYSKFQERMLENALGDMVSDVRTFPILTGPCPEFLVISPVALLPLHAYSSIRNLWLT